ncbi:hypothetical protein E8E11_004532 [Didymella keratinophila]|nr:hypothetical protein E8E11_004532 [Didymella keratinophila]
MLKLVFAQSLLYQFAINLVKATFVFQYLRIFSHLRYPKYYCFFLLFLTIGAMAWGMFGIIFLCDPVKTYWDVRAEHEGKMTKSGTDAVVWSTIELNVAIISTSLPVMKPLFAEWIPSMVSEQPMTASEDRRVMRQLTGLVLLTGDVEDEAKVAEQT